MASVNVIVANHEAVQVNYCCGISTVTVKTAKMMMIAGGVVIGLGIILIALGITAIVTFEQNCEDLCSVYVEGTCECSLNYGRIVSLFISALLCFIGGAVAIQRCHAGLKALRIRRMNAPNQPVYPGAIEFQQTAYAHPGNP
ncbi:unnamed protein product [Darwinula stevensoni]|uniref:Uncharacterized protein n=1 Tax=Darwinula stevensoni TaxID=69355 RepID=A0A7R9AEY8_9CRUS|nr:unnamed protein product [Darwinula stevensoni]CAG0902807.1 unnamed protein product [Darwinula stevensoni]